jgi:hypothetical protein
LWSREFRQFRVDIPRFDGQWGGVVNDVPNLPQKRLVRGYVERLTAALDEPLVYQLLKAVAFAK